MIGVQIRCLETAAELLAAAGDDIYVRAHVGPDGPGRGWATDAAFAYRVPGRATSWLLAVGDPVDAAEPVRAARAELPAPSRELSAPRGTVLDWIDFAEPEDWDFMVWDASVSGTELPVRPGEDRVEAMYPGPENDAELTAFLKEANPLASAEPGWKAIEVWAGIRDPETGSLLACGALARNGPGVGYLASIATLPSVRGPGLGAAVTAWLTRRIVDRGEGLCTLGHYWPNEPARRIYVRLGYRTTHEMTGAILAARGADGAGPGFHEESA